ncbi:MAG TPA: hypothetical protein VMH87_12515 [Pseudomonadales bacterium]|nr:hypothetical protein [Pseudomonadales bacterium]
MAVFEDIQDAETLETFLRDNGIEDVRIYRDKLLQIFLFLAPPHATYRAQVRQDQFEQAVRMINGIHPLVLDKAIHCPACGSLHINYPQMTRKFFLPTLLLHLGIIFRIIDHEGYCEHCHITWNLSRDASRKPPMPRPAFPFK